MLAFGLGACLAASCGLPLSHKCQTSDDCILGVCLEGVCRARQTDDGAVSDASTVDGHDAMADGFDAAAVRDAATDQPSDSPATDVPADVPATDSRDASASSDTATNDSAYDADDATTDTGDAGPLANDGGLPAHEACGPAWAEWPMPAPATLTGVPGNPKRNLPNPTSYDSSDPDIVVDNVTHLVWQRIIATDALTYAQAVSYCASLDLGGRTDWRLPSRIELVSLIDWDRPEQGNIDSVFTDSPSQAVWACTSGPAQPLDAWNVDFANGRIGTSDKISTLLARCVSGSRSSTPPPARYEASTDGTVTDVRTHLTWQAAPSPTDLTWGDGYDYCQGLGPGWRLPTVLEFHTLIDETQLHSAVDPSAFPDRPDAFYWTSSFFDSNDLQAWFVSTGLGNTYWSDTINQWRVRCVR